jgi:hypothetical protein
MFADPAVHERLLLLASVQHPAFHATWLPIYTEQGAMRAPIMLDKVMCFQIESEVIKNSKRGDLHCAAKVTCKQRCATKIDGDGG